METAKPHSKSGIAGVDGVEVFMKYFLLIFVLIFSTNVASAETINCIGIYQFNKNSRDKNLVLTSNWFRLEVKEMGDGNLTAIFSEGTGDLTVRRFQLAVKTEANVARFYYEKYLPRVEGVQEVGTDSEYIGGELLFELEEREESTASGRETVIYTIWQKMNLTAQIGEGGGEKSLFFRKVYVKRCPRN